MHVPTGATWRPASVSEDWALCRVILRNAAAETVLRLQEAGVRVWEPVRAEVVDSWGRTRRPSWAAQRRKKGVPVLGLVSCQMHSQLYRSDLIQLQRKWLLPANGE
jgi:hypothetical protein